MPACSRPASAALLVLLVAAGAAADEESIVGHPVENAGMVFVASAGDVESRAGCRSGYMNLGGYCVRKPELAADVWLKWHNIYRCVHNASYIEWHEPAAKSAQEWADGLEKLQHSNCYGEPNPAGPAGENLAGGFNPAGSASNGWYKEVNGCSWPGCPNGGHFTPMVWLGVTQLGCGRNEKRKIDVCRYRSGDKPKSCALPNMQGCYNSQVNPAMHDLKECIIHVEERIAAGAHSSFRSRWALLLAGFISIAASVLW